MPYLRIRRFSQSPNPKYAKNGEAQIFWAVIVLLLGGVVALRFSETDAERKARAEKQQEEYLRVVCAQDKKACDNLQEQIKRRRQRCELIGEDCAPHDE